MADVVVATPDGPLRGQKATSVRGGDYFSFLGIPYAKPPIGDLRFKPPQPLEPWTEIRDATKEGACSLQGDLSVLMKKKVDPTEVPTVGSEDCLFLNVFTPQLDGDDRKAVMFWIHGGGFVMGSGSADTFGPDYLITEDVVLVTINYRLGPFGFLNLQNSDCPGNNGLKDMVAALQWVQRNIASFGGDPGNVTIFGVSAGGASVNYLMLSKLSKGLFHKVIAQSGLAVNPWAFNTRPKETAFKLGELLGCKTTDEKELFEFLLHVPAGDLVAKDHAIMINVNPDDRHFRLAFVPSLESEEEGAFLTRPPEDLVRSGEFHDVHLVVGAAQMEGLCIKFLVESFPPLETVEEIAGLIPHNWVFDRTPDKCREIAQRIKDFYFPQGYSERRFIDALSAVYFTNGIPAVVENTIKSGKKSPVYVYKFSFDGDFGPVKRMLQYKEKGTTHGDETAYLFNSVKPIIPTPPMVEGTKDYKAMQDVTRLWANFAKHGDPTPEDHLWTPMTADNRQYLDIDEQLTVQQDELSQEAKFWSDLHEFAISTH